MRAWIRDFLAKRQPWADAQGEDTVSRLIRLAGSGLAGFDAERVVSNVAGLLVGAIETASQAIANATEQILLRPDVKAQAIAAAALDDPGAFDSIVWEALRYNPMTTFVLRIAPEETVLAPGKRPRSRCPPDVSSPRASARRCSTRPSSPTPKNSRRATASHISTWDSGSTFASANMSVMR
jgi:cytochrome P450